jgi:hypothetical protein
VPIELGDRRRSGRWTPSPIEALSRVRLRAGRELAVTAAQGRVLVRARVVRCAVWTVTADVITYRGALAFSASVDLPLTDLASQETSDAATRDRQPVATPQSAGEPAWNDYS